MSQRRRRAEDFTESLNSFRNDSDTTCSMSLDSLNEIKGKSSEVSDHSTILAGSSSKHSLVQNLSASSKIKPAPDLNKRINLFQTEQPDTDNKENKNSQCSMQSNVVPKIQIYDSNNKLEVNVLTEISKRDTNYNIHKNKPKVPTVKEKKKPTVKSIVQLAPPAKCTNTNKQICDTNCEAKDANTETKKFETILCLMDNQLNEMAEDKQTQQVLKRLSDKFVGSSTNFTEKLLTIIEESVINNGENVPDTSATDLSRLTFEFRKMCKFIEDESCIEWPPSPISTPPCPQISSTSVCGGNPEPIHKPDLVQNCKNENISSPISTPVPTTPLPTTPLSGIDIIRKRFFNKISKYNSNGSIDGVASDSSNISFEKLEAQCKRLFPGEKGYSKPLRRSLSVPSLLSMSQINNICEQQMASLNTTNMDETPKERTITNTPNSLDKYLLANSHTNTPKFDYQKSKELHVKSKYMQDDNISYSKKKSRKMSEKTDLNNMKPDQFASDYAIVDPDEFEKTLLQDIAEKRMRCLNTARLLSEINAAPEAIEAQKTLRMSPTFKSDNESNSLSHDENKFMQTLMSCKDYQTYLEKQKPLFKLLQRTNFSTPETDLKNIENPNLKYGEMKDSQKASLSIKKSPGSRGISLSPYAKSSDRLRSPLSKKQSEGNAKKGEKTKQKLFVTPGKTPPSINYKRKKVYFPTMLSPAKNTAEGHILKSPHVEGLFRLNYNTVISPVGMYIRGTDTQLIKNVRAKTCPSLLTPGKRSTRASPSKNIKHSSTPLRNAIKTKEEAPLKLNLSPKVDACKRDAFTPKSHFVLPKVSYKLPLQVRTIKENKSPKQGARVKKLLEATQNKVVIRHEGRINSVQKGKSATSDEVCEIKYKPEDESIHVEQAANKTNFIHNWKDV